MLACGENPTPPGPSPLKIAVHGDPSSLDPHLQSEVIAQWVLGNIYETLIAFDVNMGLVPALAERWENPHELVVRFHLRQGVTFHDGRPLTAADVGFSLDRARHHPRSRNASMLVAIDKVRQIDSSTLELVTTSPYPILLNKLPYINIVPAGSPETITSPVGTGPYRLLEHEPGHRVVLENHIAHWAGPPAEPRAEYYFISDARQRWERLLTGEMDLVGDLEPGEVSRIEESPGFQVLSRTGLVVTYLQVNPAIPPFDDIRVRRALDLAFDRGALVRDALMGHGRPVRQMISPNVFGYVPDLEPSQPDLQEARRLLSEAGHAHGLELTLEARQGSSLEPIRKQMAAIGVTLVIEEHPWSEMYARLQSREVAFYFGGWVSTSGDASDFLDHKVHSYSPDQGYGVSNSNGFSNPDVDRLIEWSATMKMEARREVLENVLRQLDDEYVFIPLYTPFDLYGVRDDLSWTPRQDGRVYAFEMERKK